MEQQALTPYDDYKPSGLDWLGDIPSHWTLKKSKFLWREKEERSANGEEQLLSVSQYFGVVPKEDDSRSESLEDYKVCKQNDLVINIMLAWMSGLGITAHDGIVSPAYCVYRQLEKHNPLYLNYLYRTPIYLAEFARRSLGIVPSRWRMYTEDFGQVLTLLPPRDEQDRIANFLDQKTAEIDEAIAKKQRLIELLKEQKAILINQAVTKGLNKTEFVETGNPFFPSIPASFTLVKLGHLCNKVADGPHFSPSYVDEGVMFISAGNIRPDGWLLDDAKKVSERDYREFCKRVVPEVGDVLYTKGGTTGVAKVVDIAERFQVWVHVAVLKLRKEKVIPSYLAFVLNSSKCYEQSQLYTRGATNKDLGLTRMVNIFLPLPPLEDQAEIVEHLNGISTDTTALIGKVAEEISGLTEYRSAMIAEAVTGKIKL